MDKNFKNQIIIAIAFSIFGALTYILMPVLASSGVVEARSFWWAFVIFYLAAVWVPVLLQLIFKKLHWTTWVILVYDIYLVASIMVGTTWDVFNMGAVFDKIVHTVGGAMFVVLVYDVFKCFSTANKLNNFWLFLLVFSFSMMCGGVWEIMEYTTDGLFNNTAQHYCDLDGNDYVGRKALEDTMLDLVCDFSGSLIAGIVVVVVEQNKKKKCTVEIMGESLDVKSAEEKLTEDEKTQKTQKAKQIEAKTEVKNSVKDSAKKDDKKDGHSGDAKGAKQGN